MKKLITIYNIAAIDKLIPYVDGFIVGNNEFAARLTNGFTLEELNQIIDITTNNKKEVFISLNRMFTDKELDSLEQFIRRLNTNKVTGFITADLGTIMLLKRLNLHEKAVYNPETLLTNYIDFNFLASENIYGAYVAKEITLEDIIKIGENKTIKMFMVGHGHLNMFYSKRYLLKNYQQLISSTVDYSFIQTLKITEPKRQEEPYPILQDYAGTHVFRSAVMSSFDYLEQLKTVVDYFIIDTIFKNDDYGLEIAKYYNLENVNVDELKTRFQEKWDQGFLNHKTYYKR